MIGAAIGLASTMFASSLAQENDAESKNAESKKKKSDTFKVLRLAADTCEIKQDKEKVERIEAPIYRYSDPARSHDGTIWAWGKKGRPLALLTIAEDDDDNRLVTEGILLSDKPLTVEYGTGGQKRARASDRDSIFSKRLLSLIHI